MRRRCNRGKYSGENRCWQQGGTPSTCAGIAGKRGHARRLESCPIDHYSPPAKRGSSNKTQPAARLGDGPRHVVHDLLAHRSVQVLHGLDGLGAPPLGQPGVAHEAGKGVGGADVGTLGGQLGPRRGQRRGDVALREVKQDDEAEAM